MEKTRNLQKAALESDERFSEALLETLDALGWTIQELSKKAGVSPSTLYKITNEKRSPSLDILRGGGDARGQFHRSDRHKASSGRGR